MRILVTNVHSTRNAGDQVLLTATVQELRRVFPACSITVAANDTADPPQWPDVTVVGSFISWFRSESGAWRCLRVLTAPWLILRAILHALFYRFARRSPVPGGRGGEDELLAAYCAADIIVSCPGNMLIADQGRGLFFGLTIFALAYGWLAGKPLYMMPQTIGPLRRPAEQRAVRWVLRRMQIVLVRDETSLATLAQIGLTHPRCHLLPDVAFLYRGAPDLTPMADLLTDHPRLHRPLIGVTVINWTGHAPGRARQERYEDAVVAALGDFLQRHDGAAILFPQVCGPSAAEDDRPPSRRIAARLRRMGLPAALIDVEMTPDQLQVAYGQMDIFVGTRLHSNIFAMTMGTPVLAIAYQYKTQGVMRMLGLSDAVLDIEQVDAATLSAAIEQLWRDRARLRAHLQEIMPGLQAQARQAAAMIAADHHSGSAAAATRG